MLPVILNILCFVQCIQADGGILTHRIKAQQKSLKIQQKLSNQQNNTWLLKQIISFLTDNELQLLFNNATQCTTMDDIYNIEQWKHNTHLKNILTQKETIVREECEAMDLSPECLQDCIYYNNVLGWLGAYLSGNASAIDEILYMVNLYSMSAGPMAYYDAGNPDMCTYNYGTYCYTPAMSEMWGLSFPIMQHACCLPGSCIKQDAIKVLHSNNWCYVGYAMIYDNLTVEGISINVMDICEPMQRELHTFGPKFVILIFCLFVLFVIIASLIKQYLMERRNYDTSTINTMSVFLASFNIQNIWEAFKSVRPQGKTQYNFLDGIRVWSMSWVVLGHSVVYFMTAGGSNMTILVPYEGSRADYKYVISEFYMVIIEYGIFAVDSFFYLSGFLATFSIYRQLKKYPGNKAIKLCYIWIPFVYLARILRIVPMMFYITSFQWQLSDQLAGGYHVTSRDTYKQFCGDSWYQILFFYSNLMISSGNIDAMNCMGHLWYIQCDMQFFLFLPWIVLCYTYKKLYGVILSIIPCIICIIIRLYEAFYYHYSANMMYPAYPTKHGGSQEEDSYFKPWNRCAPYFTGVLTMFVFIWIDEYMKQKKRKFQISNNIYFGLMFVSGFILLSLVIWPYGDVKNAPDDRWSLLANEIYYGLCMPAWGIGLALMTFALRYKSCENGQTSIVKSILSCEIYQPLGKLTYLMYLIHLLIFDWWAYDLEQPAYYTVWNELLLVIGVWTITALVSLTLWFFMEKPIANLTNALLKSMTKGKTKDEIERRLMYKGIENKRISTEQSQFDSMDGAGNNVHGNGTLYESEQTLKGYSMIEKYKQ